MIAVIIVHVGVMLGVQLVIFQMVFDGILILRQGKQSWRATHLFITRILLTIAGSIEVQIEYSPFEVFSTSILCIRIHQQLVELCSRMSRVYLYVFMIIVSLWIRNK